MLLAITASNADSTITSIQSTLTVSDWITLLGILLSTLTSIIAIVISVGTLRQNNKMIKESTRPVISIYFDYAQMGSPTGYFVVKNFGSSTATITELNFNEPIQKHPKHLADLPAIFNGLINNTIAPNQKYLAPFKWNDYTGGKAVFDISYRSQTDLYTDHFEIDIEKYGKFVKPRIKSNPDKTISYTIQEIAERLM